MGPKLKVGDRIRVKNTWRGGGGGGWGGHEATIVEVQDCSKLGLAPRYRIDKPTSGSEQSYFSHGSEVHDAVEIINDPQPSKLEDVGGILIEREDPQPNPLPIKSVKVGCEDWNMMARVHQDAIRWGYTYDGCVRTDVSDLTPAQARAFGAALIEMADQIEGKQTQAVNRPVPEVAELHIDGTLAFDGGAFRMWDDYTYCVDGRRKKETIAFLEDCLAIARSKAADRD